MFPLTIIQEYRHGKWAHYKGLNMNYQNTVTNEVLTYTELKARIPLTSLPTDGTDTITIITDPGPPPVEDEWRMIQSTPRPVYDIYTEGLAELPPVNYQQVWSVFPLDQQTIDENIASAKVSKYSESDQYAGLRIDEANADPFIGSKTTSNKNKRKVNARMNHATNGKPKSDQDKDRDDELADYTDSVVDAQDNADDVIEDSNDAQAIYAMDVETIVTWPTWNPPA